MRRTVVILLSVVVALATCSTLRADDPSEAAALVEKGLKFNGGREKVAKYKAMSWKEQGTYYGAGDGQPYTGAYSLQWPDKFRMEIQGVFTIVLNGDNGWINMAGAVQEMTAEQLAEQRENNYSGWVASLTPLNDKAYKLSLLGGTNVADRPALGVNVKHEGHRDVQLYFDKETGRLVKSESRVKSQEMGGKEVTQETFYSEYREVDGMQVPKKIAIKRDGSKFVEAEINDLMNFEKLDDSTFGKP